MINSEKTRSPLRLIFGVAGLGPIGGILAVPLTAMIKSALLPSYSATAWLTAI